MATVFHSQNLYPFIFYENFRFTHTSVIVHNINSHAVVFSVHIKYLCSEGIKFSF